MAYSLGQPSSLLHSTCSRLSSLSSGRSLIWNFLPCPPITMWPHPSVRTSLTLPLSLTFRQHFSCGSHLAYFFAHSCVFSLFPKSKVGGMVVICIKYCGFRLRRTGEMEIQHVYFRTTHPTALWPRDIVSGWGLGELSWRPWASIGPHGWQFTSDCWKALFIYLISRKFKHVFMDLLGIRSLLSVICLF